jgi:ppGpp synthetase/RelA/SpoT-type nucleotidyltranferase
VVKNKILEDGWPTIEEQKAYWRRKELDSLQREQLLRAVDAFSMFLGELNTAMGKLRKEFEKLT